MCQTVSPQPVIPFRGLSCAASAVVSVVTPHAGRMLGYTLASSPYPQPTSAAATGASTPPPHPWAAVPARAPRQRTAIRVMVSNTVHVRAVFGIRGKSESCRLILTKE